MSEAAATPAKPAALGECVIRGKIIRSRRYEGNFYTSIVMPSSDPFQRPATVEVRSSDRLGDTEEIVTVRCRISGYNGKPYNWTDKDTGESRQVVPVHNVLEAIR